MWSVDEVNQGYVDFLTLWTSQLHDLPTDPLAAVRLAFEAADHFESVFRRDPLLPDTLVPTDFTGPAARRLFLDLLNGLEAHPELAHANLFHTYRNTVANALAQNQDDFWHATFEETSIH